MFRGLPYRVRTVWFRLFNVAILLKDATHAHAWILAVRGVFEVGTITHLFPACISLVGGWENRSEGWRKTCHLPQNGSCPSQWRGSGMYPINKIYKFMGTKK